MVLVFTLVIACAIIVLSSAVLIVEINDPAAETSNASTALFNLISGMMGALLGLLAGKTDTVRGVLSDPLLPLDPAPPLRDNPDGTPIP